MAWCNRNTFHIGKYTDSSRESHYFKLIMHLDGIKTEDKQTLKDFYDVLRLQEKDLIARRDQLLQPLKDEIKDIKSACDPLLEQIEKAKTFCKKGVAKIEETERRQSIQSAIDTISDVGKQKMPKLQTGGILKKRSTIDFHITDKAQIPIEYMKTDDPKIKAVGRKGGSLPGVKFYKKETSYL